ncbi:MAG: cyclase family protein, partial [Chthoniobacterales bacterium]
MRNLRRALLFFGLVSCLTSGMRAGENSLWPLQQQLVGQRLVDLTHAFAPGIPHWPGFPNEERRTIYDFEKRPGLLGDGFFAQVFT